MGISLDAPKFLNVILWELGVPLNSCPPCRCDTHECLPKVRRIKIICGVSIPLDTALRLLTFGASFIPTRLPCCIPSASSAPAPPLQHTSSWPGQENNSGIFARILKKDPSASLRHYTWKGLRKVNCGDADDGADFVLDLFFVFARASKILQYPCVIIPGKACGG